MEDLVYSTYNLKRKRKQTYISIIEHVTTIAVAVVVALAIGMEF